MSTFITEAQAAERWCPFSRVAFLGSHVGNRPSSTMLKFAEAEAKRTGKECDARDLRYVLQQRADTNCIGSRCMAWRWQGQTHGCCGLAGTPKTEARVTPADRLPR